MSWSRQAKSGGAEFRATAIYVHSTSFPPRPQPKFTTTQVHRTPSSSQPKFTALHLDRNSRTLRMRNPSFLPLWHV
ncbi:MAG: hypothetical protein Q4G54_01315 [Pelistega sp.]|nr:hypothetical protein [Pelistega sp.]